MRWWIRAGSVHNDRGNTVYHNPEVPKNITTGFQFGNRHLQCIMIFLGVSISFCIRSHISVAIVAMTEKSNFNDAPVLPWDSRMKGTVVSAFYWSYILVLIPAGRACEKFGLKFLVVIAMLICGIVMFLTPFAAVYGGFYWMFAARILLGGAQAVIFPMVNVFCSKWVPPKEKGMIFCFIFSGMDSGILVTMVTAGALVDSRWGWPSIFYVYGGIIVLWALLYTYVGANSPQDCSSISEHEKMYILSSLPNNAQWMDNLKTPWKAIMSSIPLHALIIANSANAWAYYTILFGAPSYFNAALGFSIKQSGFTTALAYMSSLITSNVYAVMSYWLNSKKILSKTALLKSWNSLSLWGAALSLCLLAFAEENKVLAVSLVVVAVSADVACRNGYLSNHLDLAPNFAGSLMGLAVAISTVCTMSAPLCVGFIVADPTSVFSWKIVFLTAAAVAFFGNLVFVFFASTEVQPWNCPTTVKPNPESAISKDGTAEANGDNS